MTISLVGKKCVNEINNFLLLLIFSVWPWHLDLHRAGDRHARHHGEPLRGGHCHRPPHPPGPLHLPPNALPVCQLSGKIFLLLQNGLAKINFLLSFQEIKGTLSK